MEKNSLSRQTIERLMAYADYLRSLGGRPPATISATHIAEHLGLNQVVVRKDLAAVSAGGRPKVGYETGRLLADVEHALGHDQVNRALLVGAGNLGRALLAYQGFRQYGVEIVAAVDSDPLLVGQTFGQVTVSAGEKLDALVKSLGVAIGVITVPAETAQAVCSRLVLSGIKAIWNFAPVSLVVPPDVMVRSENMALSLALLSQHLAGKRN